MAPSCSHHLVAAPRAYGMTEATLHPSRNDVPVLLVHKLVMDRPSMDDERTHLEDWWLEREVADAAVEGIGVIHYHSIMFASAMRFAAGSIVPRTRDGRRSCSSSLFFPLEILTTFPPSLVVSGQHLESGGVAGAPPDATNPRRRLPHTDGRPVPHPALYRNTDTSTTDPRSRRHPAIAN